MKKLFKLTLILSIGLVLSSCSIKEYYSCNAKRNRVNQRYLKKQYGYKPYKPVRGHKNKSNHKFY